MNKNRPIVLSDRAELGTYQRWRDFRLDVHFMYHTGAKDTPPDHRHIDFCELVVVREGEAAHVWEKRRYHLRAGSVFLIHPGQVHRYCDFSGLGIYNVLFGTRLLREFTSDLFGLAGCRLLFNVRADGERLPAAAPALNIDAGGFPEVLRLLDTMRVRNRRGGPGIRSMLVSDLLRLLVSLGHHCRTEEEAAHHRHARAVAKFLARLDQEYAREWYLESMAAAAGMAAETFRKAFKHSTGMAPAAYLLQLRLERAAWMLGMPEFSVTEVAVKAGFGDSNYFSHRFREAFGIPPREFRRRHHQAESIIEEQ